MDAVIRSWIIYALESNTLTIDELQKMVMEEILKFKCKVQERCAHEHTIDCDAGGYHYKECTKCKKTL